MACFIKSIRDLRKRLLKTLTTPQAYYLPEETHSLSILHVVHTISETMHKAPATQLPPA